MSKEMVVAYIKVLSRHLPETGGFRTHDIWLADTDLNSGPRIRSTRAKHSNTMLLFILGRVHFYKLYKEGLSAFVRIIKQIMRWVERVAKKGT